MKKQIFFVTMLLVAMFAAQALAVTAPTPDDNTLVSSPGNGIIVVKANGNNGWTMTTFCQDNLRAGCGNNVIVKPSELSGDGNTMTFKIDQAGIDDGQVAFNFRDSSGRWLLLPDCRVKTGNNVGLGLSFYSSDIADSGGTHFVYTGSGIRVWHPVSTGACNEAKASAARTTAARVASSTTRETTEATAKVGANINSSASQAVGVINKNGAVQAAGDEIVGSQMNVVVKVGTCGGKHLKKGETCKDGHAVNVYAVKHGDTNVSQKGHVVKNNTFKDKAFIYNAPVYNFHGSKYGSNECSSCHNNSDWYKHKQDSEAKNFFFKNLTTNSKKGK